MIETLPIPPAAVKNEILESITTLIESAELSGHRNIAIKTTDARWMIDSLAALNDANGEIDRLEGVIAELVGDAPAPAKKIQVTVTEEYLARLISFGGGISYDGLELIGEPRDWLAGWKKRCIGRVLMVDPQKLGREIKSVEARRIKNNLRNKAREAR